MSLAALLAELNIDPYEVLGVSPDADLDTVKRTYHRIALECHPDRNPADPVCEERFKLATAAFEILSDPRKRAEYSSRLRTQEYMRTQECMHHARQRTGKSVDWAFLWSDFAACEGINDYQGNKQPFLRAALRLALTVGRILKRVGFTSKAHINQGGPAVSGEVYAHYGRNSIDVLVMYGTCGGVPCILAQIPHDQTVGNHDIDTKSTPSEIAGEVVRYYERYVTTRR
jgi:hypothetical protein